MLKLVGNRLTVTGKAGTSRYVLFSGSAGGSSIDLAKTAVQLKVPRLKPTRKLVKSLNKTLKSKRFKVKTLGTVLGGSTAYFPPLAPKPENPSQGYWTEPTLPTRPPTAADVTTASPLDWWARVSWVNYIGQPAQLTGVTALGAINTCGEALPPATGVEYNNGFRYPFNATGSWWDAASQTGVLNYSGSVRFFFPDRFDISFVDPQIVIQPSGRTMNMRIVTATYPSGKNADMFRLVAGSTFDYDVMTDSATDGVFAGMYPKNDTFGCSIFSYTQP